jgi:hypothetical protein
MIDLMDNQSLEEQSLDSPNESSLPVRETPVSVLQLDQLSTPEPVEPGPNAKPPHRSRRPLIIAGVVVGCLLIAGGIFWLVKLQTKPQPKPATHIVINTQSLDNGTLNKLTNPNDGTVSQQLTITPDTLFKSSVTVQGTTKLAATTVAGTLGVNGDVTLAKALTVNGSTTLSGNVTVAGQLTTLSFATGSLSATTLNLTGDATLGGHLIPTGANPSIKPSVATNGGTVTISGNDTAGTITINVSSALPHSGEFAIITFKKPFNTTPKIQITPLNAAASELRYYATASPTFFTIDSSSIPTAGGSYVFDYLVTQ